MECRICGNKNNNNSYLIKEMFIGTRDEYEYFECSKCKCLQIKEIPLNIEKYYPKNYYSYNPKMNKIKRFFGKRRDFYVIFKKGIVGRIINLFEPSPYFKKIKKTNINFNLKKTKILDVGCGSGQMLQSFGDMGFEHLTGIDPFIENNIELGKVKIFKKFIEELPQNKMRYDLIIFNHSFEHIFDQQKTLKNASQLLSKDGVLIISMPMKSEFIWEKYGINWVQIDAPRHFILHTCKSFRILLNKVNLKIINYRFDSGAFQFYGSEQYKKNIPLKSPKSYYINPKNSIFNSKEINEFITISNKLNKINQGDTATFYLSKSR